MYALPSSVHEYNNGTLSRGCTGSQGASQVQALKLEEFFLSRIDCFTFLKTVRVWVFVFEGVKQCSAQMANLRARWTETDTIYKGFKGIFAHSTVARVEANIRRLSVRVRVGRRPVVKPFSLFFLPRLS